VTNLFRLVWACKFVSYIEETTQSVLRVRFDVLNAANMKMAVFCVVTPCRPVEASEVLAASIIRTIPITIKLK
jgi:hypothetical protein